MKQKDVFNEQISRTYDYKRAMPRFVYLWSRLQQHGLASWWKVDSASDSKSSSRLSPHEWQHWSGVHDWMAENGVDLGTGGAGLGLGLEVELY